MKKIFALLLVVLPLSAMAQKFGYMNYDQVMKQMPEYGEVQEHLTALKAQYQEEMRRSEEEFNRKYNDFLDIQKSLQENILVRRQKELQGLFESGIAFRKECEDQLKKAEEELLAGIKSNLNKVIGEVGAEMELEYILNTTDNALLFVGPNGTDITAAVIAKLGN